MFGVGWEDGNATIVARQIHTGMYRGHAPTSEWHSTYDYVADVHPENGAATFRATFTELFKAQNERRPDVGDEARVKFHAKSGKVQFDRSPLRSEGKATAGAARQEFEAIATAAPGSPPAGPATFEQQTVGFAEQAATFRQRAGESREQLEIMAAIMRAKTSGDLAEVERLKAELTQHLAERSGSSGSGPDSA
jgi:hypothetical protein